MAISSTFRLVSGLTLCIALLTLVPQPSAAQNSRTFVLGHGAWGGSWSFKQVAQLLSQQGHTVYRPSLTGLGERVHLSSPDIDVNTHILDVVNTILFENLENVVLLGHSYGGMVISGVADSIPERIQQLIYLDAFYPLDGQSVVTARDDEQAGPEDGADDDYIIPKWVNTNDPLPRDVPQSRKTFTTPVKRSNPQAAAILTTYLLTVDSLDEPQKDFFYYFAERAKRQGAQVRSMSADHNPQRSNPQELVQHLEEIVN